MGLCKPMFKPENGKMITLRQRQRAMFAIVGRVCHVLLLLRGAHLFCTEWPNHSFANFIESSINNTPVTG